MPQTSLVVPICLSMSQLIFTWSSETIQLSHPQNCFIVTLLYTVVSVSSSYSERLWYGLYLRTRSHHQNISLGHFSHSTSRCRWLVISWLFLSWYKGFEDMSSNFCWIHIYNALITFLDLCICVKGMGKGNRGIAIADKCLCKARFSPSYIPVDLLSQCSFCHCERPAFVFLCLHYQIFEEQRWHTHDSSHLYSCCIVSAHNSQFFF